MEAVRARRSIDGRADPITWICSITRNRRIDHYRRVERDQVRHLRLIVTDLHASETSSFFSRCRIWLATVTLLPIPGSQEMTTWRISWPLISGVSDHAPGSQTLARVRVEWGVESPVHATAVPSGPGAEP